MNIRLISLLALLLIAGCRREQWLQATLPTLAVLPSETPSITISPTLAINPNVTAPVINEVIPVGIVSLTPTPVGTYYTPTITPSPLPFWMMSSTPSSTFTATFTRTPTLTPTDVPAARRTFAVDMPAPQPYDPFYVDPSLPTYTPYPTPDVRDDVVDMPLPEFPEIEIASFTPYPTNDGSYRATIDSIEATAAHVLGTLVGP